MTHFIYSHAKYAGNKGDLWKHGILYFLVQKLQNHLGPLRIVDSHGGEGVYNLRPGGGWRRGLGELPQDLPTEWLDHPWLSSVRNEFRHHNRYYGSWWQLLKHFPESEVTVIDHNTSVINKIKENCEMFGLKRCTPILGDSFKYLENTDCHLLHVDPAYRLAEGLGDDWEKLKKLTPRWDKAGQRYLIWYQLFGPKKPSELVACSKGTSLEIHWPTTRKSKFVPKGCGMLLDEKSYQLMAQDSWYYTSLAALLGGGVMERSQNQCSSSHLYGDKGTFS